MSDSLNDVRNNLTTWYMGLDERTQYYFEAAYTENRRAIANALGGYTVTADELAHYATLAALLAVDADGGPGDVVPRIAPACAPYTEPATISANQAFKLDWVDINYGTRSPGYDDIVLIRDGSNTDVFQSTVGVGSLDQGAQTTVGVDVPGLAAGTYALQIIHNAYGPDPEYAQYAQRNVGLRSFTDVAFVVAASE